MTMDSQIEVAVGAAESLLGDAVDGDLFDQLLVVGVEGIEAVDLVVLGLVGGGVAQDEERLNFASESVVFFPSIF